MKLTSADLDAAIASGAPLRPMIVVRARNGVDEMLVLGTEAAPHELPPMDLPQPTEPFHLGATFKRPAPQRSMWQDEFDSRWLLALYAAAVLLGAFAPVIKGWFA